ncbi:MAG: glycosyltransferase [Lachnospiraceae bacterium]|nr:glycosyltransferase [Lachnospiraceae bacterium]
MASIISQTYTNWDPIIVDDASNDNTAEIVKGMDDSRICYVKNEKIVAPIIQEIVGQS